MVLLNTTCVNLPAILLEILSLRAKVKIISIPDEEYYAEMMTGCNAPKLVKVIWSPIMFCNHPPLQQMPLFICGHRGAASTRHNMICFVLYTALYRSFLKHCTLTNKAVGTTWRASPNLLRGDKVLIFVLFDCLSRLLQRFDLSLLPDGQMIVYSGGCLYIYMCIYCFYHLICLCYIFGLW